jgi:phage tail sheath gpL-like
MAISFESIPPNLRVPLAYFEFSADLAGRSNQIQNALILCTVPANAALPVGVPTLIRSADHARALAGTGSALGRQCQRWFQNNRAGVPLYALAAAETGFAVSTGLVTFGGAATEAGTVPLYVGGRRVSVIVANGDDAEEIALAARTAINADERVGVGASVNATTAEAVDIAALQPGVLGRLPLGVALEGDIGGEYLPDGVTVTITQMTAGAGSPNVADMLDAVGDEPFDFVLCPFVVRGNANNQQHLIDLDAFFNATTGRWSWESMLYGHGWTAFDDTLGALQTLGGTRNGEHVTIFGVFNSATPSDEVLAAYSGQCAGSLVVDPARPTQGLPLIGVRLPPIQDRFTVRDKQVLYFTGIASYQSEGGIMATDRIITTYQRNRWGAPDDSMLDVETLFSGAAFARFMRGRVLLKFPRSKLADDGTRFGAGQAIVTPSIIRAEMVAAYAELEESGLVENADGFEEALIVERNQQDRNRVDVLLPPDFVNQLRIFAALVQWVG